jgi:hypothetical protein
LRSLDRYSIRDGEASAEAVHLAILKLCQGKLWRVRELVQEARRDFRDVLYPAQSDLKAWYSWLASHGP